ncbi:MAG: pectin methylesterase [Oscillospiraceae bacterium]|jgi:pectinesterase|nr:pectin methylesterase [Oscillospiraceae bacterium]
MKTITVSKTGGDYTSIQTAVNSIPRDNGEWVEIRIKPGEYHERLEVETPYIRFVGEDAMTTRITYNQGASTVLPDGARSGTFRSYTVFFGTHDLAAENITFENAAGPGYIAGQSLALYADGDRIAFRNCRFLGYQDTIFTGPLPPSSIIPNSFSGPRETSPRINGRQYYENCFIRGDVDFIFGSATAYFQGCEIFSKKRNDGRPGKSGGYATAASTAEGQRYGYIFHQCRFTSDNEAETVYLGRPWRNFAHTAVIRCQLGEHIHREGWHNWNKPDAEKTARYEEYGNEGPGASLEHRPGWIRRLTAEQAAEYTVEKVLGGEDGWNPKS